MSKERDILAEKHGKVVPLVVKLSPDMDGRSIAPVAKVLLDNGIEGAIVSNTTTTRNGVEGEPFADELGGLSGAPLRNLSSTALQRFADALRGRVAIIASGGIMSADDVRERLSLGASLVQLYTGLVYRGPALVHEAALASVR